MLEEAVFAVVLFSGLFGDAPDAISTKRWHWNNRENLPNGEKLAGRSRKPTLRMPRVRELRF